MAANKILCPALAVGCLILPLPGTSLEGAKSPPLPKQISRYYDGYNFVCSFSTKEERNRLRACLKGGEPSAQPGDARLKKVLDAMKSLQVRVQSIDPEMAIPPQPVVYIDYAGIVEVREVSVSGEKATVHITVYGLEPEASLWLISQYDRAGGDEDKLPPPERRLDLARTSKFQRKEIHHWTRFKSGWKKSEVNLILLKN